MRNGERITLLVIPESGGKTFEMKVHRWAVMAAGAGGVFLVLLLTLGVKSFVDARSLTNEVAALQRQKALLEDEVGQIEQLEQVLARIEKSNRQLRAILGEPVSQAAPSAVGEPQANSGDTVPDALRLRQGDLRDNAGPRSGSAASHDLSAELRRPRRAAPATVLDRTAKRSPAPPDDPAGRSPSL